MISNIRMRPWEWVAAIVIAAICGFVLYLLILKPYSDFEDKLRSLRGSSVTEVERVLGPPKHVIHKHDDLMRAFEGYEPQPQIPVENRVSVYYHLNRRGYLYIDKGGRVSHVAFAGT